MGDRSGRPANGQEEQGRAVPSAVEARARAELQGMADELEQANRQLVEAIAEARAFGAEMAARTAQLGGLHDILEATLARSSQALLVVDAHLVVRGWSGGAADRFAAPSARVVGRRLAALRCAGLPAASVAAAVRDVLVGRPPEGDACFVCHPVPGAAEVPAAVVVVFDRPATGASAVDDAPTEPGDDARQPA